MKHFLFLCFTLFASLAFSQGVFMDTIKLNKNNPATLVFPDSVIFTLIGNNPFRYVGDAKEFKYYQISEVNNIIIIESSKEINPATASITVKTANNTYYGYICYQNSVQKSFFSFVPPLSEEPKKPLNDAESADETEVFRVKKNTISEDSILKCVRSVMAMPNDYTHIVDIKGNVIFQVGNIVNDLKYSYIKLIIQNNSASTYAINGVVFKFEEGKKGVFKKKDVVNTEWINAVKIIYPENKNVESYSFQNIGIVVPLYNGVDGQLILKVLEINGTRTALINISSKDINGTKVF